jgi:hypothetical protein
MTFHHSKMSFDAPRRIHPVDPFARFLGMRARSRRPDPAVLSEAIPLFLIGRNKDELWIARDADGRSGGLFLFKRSALRFARSSTAPVGCATMLVHEPFELDVENSGNPFAPQLAAALRRAHRVGGTITRTMSRVAAMMRRPIRRWRRALAQERLHRAAIEKELFGGRCRLSSKNDDDLPLMR